MNIPTVVRSEPTLERQVRAMATAARRWIQDGGFFRGRLFLLRLELIDEPDPRRVRVDAKALHEPVDVIGDPAWIASRPGAPFCVCGAPVAACVCAKPPNPPATTSNEEKFDLAATK